MKQGGGCRLIRAAAIVSTLWALLGCSGQGREPAPHPPAPVAFVELLPAKPKVLVGGLLWLTALPTDELGEDLPGREVRWSSADEDIATVDPLGLVTGIGPGSVEISAEVEGVRANVLLLVAPAPLSRVEIEPLFVELVEGERRRLSAVGLDVWGEPMGGLAFHWSSSEPSVAEVDAEGLVDALSAGVTTIMAEAAGIRASVRAEVWPLPVGSLSFVDPPTELYVDRSVQLAVLVLDEAGAKMSGVPLTWHSSPPYAASVDEGGRVEGLLPGAATIRVQARGVEATLEFQVLNMPVVEVRLEPAALEIEVGEEAALQVSAIGPDGGPILGRAVEWRSSDEEIAAITTHGVVQGIAAGEATISASVDGRSAAVAVQVHPPFRHVAALEISPPSPWVGVGQRLQLEALAFDAYGNELPPPPLEWRSSQEWFATVDADGVAHGWNLGETTITASAGAIAASTTLRTFRPLIISGVRIEGELHPLLLNESRQLVGRVLDQDGQPISGQQVVWSSADEEILTVEAGLVRGLAPGTTTLRASVASFEAEVEIEVVQLRFQQVSIGIRDTCGLTTGGAIYCWGWGDLGVRKPLPTLLPAPQGVRFREVSIGGTHLCAIDEGDEAYCFGQNFSGQLGTGDSQHAFETFVKVHGAQRFRTIEAGHEQTIGVTEEGELHWWGTFLDIFRGGYFKSPAPMEIPAPVPFSLVGISLDQDRFYFTNFCGVAESADAYCWGPNALGDVGDETNPEGRGPTKVPGDIRFLDVQTTARATGSGTTLGTAVHSCGVDLEGLGFCWGANLDGELGIDEPGDSPLPTQVSGEHRFRTIGVRSPRSGSFSCGLSVEGEVLCWGMPAFLWDTASNVPTKIPASGIRFSQLTVGETYLCGIDQEGLLHCWGENIYNQLGTGLSDPMLPEPTPVFGQVAED